MGLKKRYTTILILHEDHSFYYRMNSLGRVDQRYGQTQVKSGVVHLILGVVPMDGAQWKCREESLDAWEDAHACRDQDAEEH